MTRIVWLAPHRTLIAAAFVPLAMLASPLERALAAPQPQAVDTGTESEPFQRDEEPDPVTDSFIIVPVQTMPAGRVVIVEHVSARVQVPVGQAVKGTVHCQGPGLGAVTHTLIFIAQGTFQNGAATAFAASHVMRCFAGQGGIQFVIQRNSVDSTTSMTGIEVSVSGHLRR
jgi:hypothetical protein